MNKDESKLVVQQEQLNTSVIMRLLSNDTCDEMSEIMGRRLGNSGELIRDDVRVQAFEHGFMYARKLILDYLKYNNV
jgi:hypothetical protein